MDKSPYAGGSVGKLGSGVKEKGLFMGNAGTRSSLIHHQGIIPAFAGTGSAALVRLRRIAFDRSSRSTLRLSKGLRRIAPYASVVAPRRLASNTSLVIRNAYKMMISVLTTGIDGGYGFIEGG